MRRLRTRAVWAAALYLGCLGCHNAEAPKPQIVPPPVEVSVPLTQQVTEYDYFTGRTEAVESVEVRARVSGYLDKLHFKPGSIVKGPESPGITAASTLALLASRAYGSVLSSAAALCPERWTGQLLFEIDPRPYQAELEKAEGQVALNLARFERLSRDYDRYRTLLPQQGVSQQEYDKVLGDLNEAKGALQAAQAAVSGYKLNLQFCRVTAPITGRVGVNQITTGNLVKQDQTVLTYIVSVQPMYAYFDVDERTVLRVKQMIREGKRKSAVDSRVAVELALADDNSYPFEGYIDFVDVRLDPKTGTLRVRGEFPNEQAILTPGLFCRVRIPAGPPREALLVTERALLMEQGEKLLMVVDDKNVVHARPVKVGPLSGGLRVINSGITAHDRVVINGIQRVRPGMTVEPKTVAMLNGR